MKIRQLLMMSLLIVACSKDKVTEEISSKEQKKYSFRRNYQMKPIKKL